MNRSTLRSMALVLASAVAALFPVVAGAQSIAPTISADELRNDFVRQGYQADLPTTWWTTDHVITFRVYDFDERSQPTGRVLMVLVYPDAAAAERAGAGAQLVPGYGPSLLRANVALVQSTFAELQRRYAEELERDMPGSSGRAEARITSGPALYRVEDDFAAVLVNRTQADL
jgi:hypothetical protein